MAVLDDLGVYLQAQGVGTLGSTLFKAIVPQDAPGIPDQLVSLFEVPSPSPELTHDSAGVSVEQPVVQVRVRGVPFGYAAARTKAQQAFVALGGVANATLNGVYYRQILLLQSPFSLGTDENNRPIIVFNARCLKAV